MANCSRQTKIVLHSQVFLNILRKFGRDSIHSFFVIKKRCRESMYFVGIFRHFSPGWAIWRTVQSKKKMFCIPTYFFNILGKFVHDSMHSFFVIKQRCRKSMYFVGIFRHFSPGWVIWRTFQGKQKLFYISNNSLNILGKFGQDSMHSFFVIKKDVVNRYISWGFFVIFRLVGPYGELSKANKNCFTIPSISLTYWESLGKILCIVFLL